MTKAKKVVTARHGTNRKNKHDPDPQLTILGVWEAFVLGCHLRWAGRLWNPVFLTSHSKRCVQTALIARLWFPETWWRSSKMKRGKRLFASAFAGDTVSEESLERVVKLLSKPKNDVVVITHHQLTSGRLLNKLSTELKLSFDWDVNEKLTPGGAHVLDCTTGEITQLCGSWLKQD